VGVFFNPQLAVVHSIGTYSPLWGIEKLPAIQISDPGYSMNHMNTFVTPTRPCGKSSPFSDNEHRPNAFRFSTSTHPGAKASFRQSKLLLINKARMMMVDNAGSAQVRIGTRSETGETS
jgi:hypothetical protein